MTLTQFKTLRVNDTVYLPDAYKPGKMWATQVLGIHPRRKRLTVFLGSKPYSYRYPSRTLGERQISHAVWLGTSMSLSPL